MKVDGSHSHSFLVDKAKPLETDESKGDITVFSISHPRMRGDGLVLSRNCLHLPSFFFPLSTLLPGVKYHKLGYLSQVMLQEELGPISQPQVLTIFNPRS